MTTKEVIHLDKIYKSLGKVHLEISLDFLRSLFVLASTSKEPYKDKRLIRQLGTKINKTTKTSTTIYGWLNGKRKISLEKLITITKISGKSWNSIEKEILSLKSGKSDKGRIYPKCPIKINFKVGSIVGHILGDGSIESKYQQLFYSNSNKELLTEFFEYMKEIFRIEPRIWMQAPPTFHGKTRWDKRLKKIEELKKGRTCGLFYPSICGKILNSYFNNFAIGSKKEITSKILKSNKEFKRGLIRAFYDDEGSVTTSNNIRLFQDKKEILRLFRLLLSEFKITSGDIKTYIKRDKERFYFNIYRKTNFIKFEKEIGFTSSKKKKRLQQLTLIKNHKNSK